MSGQFLQLGYLAVSCLDLIGAWCVCVCAGNGRREGVCVRGVCVWRGWGGECVYVCVYGRAVREGEIEQ